MFQRQYRSTVAARGFATMRSGAPVGIVREQATFSFAALALPLQSAFRRGETVKSGGLMASSSRSLESA